MDRYHITAQIDDRSVRLKRPTMYTAIDLSQWVDRTFKAAQGVAIPDEGTSEILAAVKQQTSYYNAVYGRLIGRLWAAEPAINAEGATPELYGLAVYLELEDRGWCDEEITALGDACIQVLNLSISGKPSAKKVRASLDFGEGPEGGG